MKNGMRTVFIIFMVVIFSYFVLNFFSGVNDTDFYTETVIYSAYSDYVDISGIALKYETVINSDSDKTNDIIYSFGDGDRVPVGSTVATYNTSGVGDDSFSDILDLNSKIKQISASVDKAIMYDVDGIDGQIKNEISNILRERKNKSVSSLSDEIDELQILFNKKDIAVNGDGYYTDALRSYSEERSGLLSSRNTDEKKVISETSGYFCVTCDGYENISPDDYIDITVDLYNQLISTAPEEVSPYSVGKIQNYASWYFLSLLDTSEATNLSVGGKVDILIDFPLYDKRTVSFVVQDISNSVNDKSAVIFRCDTATADTVSLRKADAKLMKKSYDGFKISSDALRIVDGQYGVYVLLAQRVVFKPIEILYSGSDFHIVTAAKGASRVLTSKDEVIVGGKDLYNGKIVNK